MGRGARRQAQLLCSHPTPESPIPPIPPCHGARRNAAGQKELESRLALQSPAQGDVLSPVPKQGEVLGSSGEPPPPWREGVHLGWLPDPHQAALSLPLFNSSPRRGAALCESQTNKSWLGKTRGWRKRSSEPVSPFQQAPFYRTSLGRAKGMVLSGALPCGVSAEQRGHGAHQTHCAWGRQEEEEGEPRASARCSHHPVGPRYGGHRYETQPHRPRHCCSAAKRERGAGHRSVQSRPPAWHLLQALKLKLSPLVRGARI